MLKQLSNFEREILLFVQLQRENHIPTTSVQNLRSHMGSQYSFDDIRFCVMNLIEEGLLEGRADAGRDFVLTPRGLRYLK